MNVRRFAHTLVSKFADRKIDWGDPKSWSTAYRSGENRDVWDYYHASPELAGFIASGIVPNNATILDVGCGSGRDAVYLAAIRSFQVHGVDFCPEAIEQASTRSREIHATVSWYIGDATQMPFQNDKFDLICDRGCFHVLSESQRNSYGREITRTLKVGGILFLRGAARNERPFNPITQKSLELAFDAKRFKVGPLVPFYLVNNGGGIDAVLTVVSRTN